MATKQNIRHLSKKAKNKATAMPLPRDCFLNLFVKLGVCCLEEFSVCLGKLLARDLTGCQLILQILQLFFKTLGGSLNGNSNCCNRCGFVYGCVLRGEYSIVDLLLVLQSSKAELCKGNLNDHLGSAGVNVSDLVERNDECLALTSFVSYCRGRYNKCALAAEQDDQNEINRYQNAGNDQVLVNEVCIVVSQKIGVVGADRSVIAGEGTVCKGKEGANECITNYSNRCNY